MLKKRWLWAFLALAIAGAGYAYTYLNAYQPADSRFTGAYRFDDGRLSVITPLKSGHFRLRFQSGGEVRRLRITKGDAFEAIKGFVASSTAPSTTGRFKRSADGHPIGLELATGETADRLPLAERVSHFDSGELSLRGKLVLPPGPGPHPVVVFVHGSEDYSAVDYYYMPYLFAAHGIAGMVYDKRGTGASTGEYTQNFFDLADDAAAAAAWASSQAEIDGQRINLVGFSQGGWIAPLAAKRISSVRAISIHYGVAVPVTREDRWGYVYALTKQGFGKDAIRKADEMNAVLTQIVDEGNADALSDLKQLIEQHKDSDWFEAVKGSDSILGMVSGSSMPSWAWRIFLWFQPPPSAPRTWDPAPTLTEIDVPQQWILAGEDSSAPTPESVAVLEHLRAEGAPIDIRVFEGTEHGIVTFKEDESGKRTPTGYAKTYIDEVLAWLKSKNDIAK